MHMLRILSNLKNPSGEVAALFSEYEVHDFQEDEPLSSVMARNNYNIVLLEDRMELLPLVKQADPRAEVILVGKGKSNAVKSIKLGAYAYLSKPVVPDELGNVIRRIEEEFQMRRATAELEKQLHEKYTFMQAVGKNPKMLDIFAYIRRIAPYYRSVLVAGETGTGKEVIAKALHELSCPGRPFVVCNCGGLTENLVESELFGHKRGAFTGAISDKMGLFETAEEGNIFLDEIGELPISFQPHFLRVLQDGEFRPVGSNRTVKAKCKIIAATNKDLSHKVTEGTFRQDLYYRLTPLVINLPPLRERKDDIALLSRFLLDRFN